ncbi:MAG TPA: hypothetical protein VLA89_17280 [Gemmatimonadales bacterium]|nr:hypothetical protein [Gemmatimonadales bacterium]
MTRYCAYSRCGKRLFRRTYASGPEGLREFQNRIHCNRSCANRHIAQLRPEKLHAPYLGDIQRIYDEREGRVPPNMMRVVEEVRAEIAYIRGQRGLA